jgi:hypothetical protein
MESKVLVARLASTVFLLTSLAAGRAQVASKAEEPFRSFRIMDSQLTFLTHQQESLKAGCNAKQADCRTAGTRSLHRTIARKMSLTVAKISSTAAKLQRLYQTRDQPFGVRMFKAIRTRAGDVQRSIDSVAQARTHTAADRAIKNLDESMVSLIAQFQAASGGYGATRCSAGAWACCEPKRSKDLLQSEQLACMWTCVQTSQRCSGFLGPRIPRP